ncbi:MAG: hypothetical protein WC052_05885 [Patescibacteria group bacterium]|jgi:hypothetical protein
MTRMVLIFMLLAIPAFAADAPTYHAIDEMQERANSYIAALTEQRNEALNQVVQLRAELDKVKKEKNCGK